MHLLKRAEPAAGMELESPESARRALHRTSAREAAMLMLLAVVVGLCAGMSAVVLNTTVHGLIAWMTRFHNAAWMIVLPAIGAALSSLFLHRILKDHAGHGVPELIRASNFGGGSVRTDMVWSRLVSSFLTIGSGGSAGLEGPIATSGGAIGSAIGGALRFNERRRTLLLGYGAAAGIAAIFNAPVTGAVFGLEVVLGEWSAMSILPTIVACVSATQVSRLLLGNQIDFPHQLFHFTMLDMGACIVLGIISGLVSVAFQRGLRITEEISHSMERVPPWVRAAAGGLIVGIFGFFMPSVLHDGYVAIRGFLSGVGQYTLLGVAAFVAIKLVATSLTLGSGGSGGVFAPALVLGSGLGYGFGDLLHTVFSTSTLATPSAYGLVGMAGMVAGIMHAPLTGMFLVLEVTDGYELILPLMIVAVLAMLVGYFFEEGSVYTRELIDRGEMARRGSDAHLLHTMQPRELVDPEDTVVTESMLLGEFVEIFKYAKRNIFPVVDKDTHTWMGVVYLDDLRPYLFDTTLYNIMTMGSVLHTDLPTIDARETALSAIQKFESSGAWSLPVIEDGRFLGMMSKSTLFDRYRRELIVHTHE